MAFDKTNTAIVFVEEGLFNKDGVEALGKKPVIVVKANIDGVEKEISLWFATDKETGQYKLTKQGNKMLTGKVSDPYQGDGFINQDATPKPEFAQVSATPVATSDDDIPF